MTGPHLVAIGGAHPDRRGQSFSSYVANASNPGVMREEVGGVAFNALRVATRRGVQATLIAARGDDAAGATVAAAIAAAGIADLSSVHAGAATPSYTAIIDNEGEMVAALASMELYENAFTTLSEQARRALATADAILIDTNLPEPPIIAIVAMAAEKPLYAIGISPAKVQRLRSVLSELSCLFLNSREAAALGAPVDDDAGTATALRQRGLARAIVTCGGAPLIGMSGDEMFTLAPPKIEAGDVTGAGDALAGATIAALMRGLPMAEATRQGVAAACLVAGDKSAAAQFGDDAFAAMLPKVPSTKPLAPATAKNTSSKP